MFRDSLISKVMSHIIHKYFDAMNIQSQDNRAALYKDMLAAFDTEDQRLPDM